MKKRILIYILFLMSFGQMLWGQTACETCSFNLVPVSACCAKLQLYVDQPCISVSNEIRLNSDGTSNNGIITSAVGEPGITATINGQYEAVFTSPNNFLDPALAGTIQDIGEICFTDVTSVVSPVISTVDNTGMTICDDIAEFSAECPIPGDFKKLTGSAEDEIPNRIRAFGDGVYVVGKKKISGSYQGFISKFDITDGSILWQEYYNYTDETQFNDIAYDPASGKLFVVGHSTVAGSLDNESFICVYSTNGTLGASKRYNHNGREIFRHVVVHRDPVDTNFPIYVLGQKNVDGQPASSTDLTMLYNFDANLNVNFFREYPEINGNEVEIFGGLKDLSGGDLIFLGQGPPNNAGLLIEVDGFGNFQQSIIYTSHRIDLFGAIETPTGEVILSGTDFGTNEAILLVVDRTSFAVQTGIKEQNISNFKEVWMDDNNKVYAVGTATSGSPQFNVVHQYNFNSSGGTPSLTLDYSRYLYDSNYDLSFESPHIYVDPYYDKIFYTDARTATNSYGGIDLLVSVTELDFLCGNCGEDFFGTNSAYTSVTGTIGLTDPIKMPPQDFNLVVEPYMDECKPFCNPLNCDFTFTGTCSDRDFTATVTGGTAPYTYQWDIGCDNTTFEGTGQSYSHTFTAFPGIQSYTEDVCLIITDAAGFTCEVEKQVFISDINAPSLNCPTGTITLNTDPSECFATYNLNITATDDCDDDVSMYCVVTGATGGDENTNQFNKGLTIVECFAEDDVGNLRQCYFEIDVVDNELPTITCPANITTSVPGCDGGATVTYADPVATDNCPMVTWTYSHPSETFFPCGTTTVTATATDMSGNQNTCTFTVTVNCQCAEVAARSTSCVEDAEDQLDFSITLNSLSGLIFPEGNCSTVLTSSQTGVTLNNYNSVWIGMGTQLLIIGNVTISGCPFPDDLFFTVNFDCVCPNQPNLDCDVNVAVPIVCCKTIGIADSSICREGPIVYVPIERADQLCDIQQVVWYVADAPCPPSSWIQFQVTNYYADLILDPQYFNGDVCVYAEVFTGNNDGPCKPKLVTDTATITLCPPVSCSISASQEYCYTGTPITPTLLTGSLSSSDPLCPDTIQWYDDNGNAIPGATSLTYQPPALSLPNGSQDCKQVFTYRMEVRSKCGVQSCTASITLHNDDAPVGTLVMDPLEPTPFCPGEDATLRYTPECAGDPAEWFWHISSPNDGPYTQITTAGTMNPLYNTNRLYQDTWYAVTKQNGTCAIDSIKFFIPVNPPLSLTSFTAASDPFCDPTQVVMNTSYQPTPAAGCSYIVEWYKNGQLLQTTTTTSLSATYTYVPANTSGIAGNYYVIIKSDCCNEAVKSNVITVDPPCEVAVAGPCFRCNDQIVTLDGIVTNPIAGATCTYQWYDENGLILGATGTSLQVNPTQAGPFTFEKTCTKGAMTCIKSATFNLKQCGSPIPPPCADETILTASDGLTSELFANAVATNGNRIVIGARDHIVGGNATGAVYVYEWNSGTSMWDETKLLASDGEDADFFGSTVAISGDRIVVGAYRNDDNGSNSGSTYIFEWNNGTSTWDETKLTASDAAGFDQFGYAVDIDGDRIVVGAINNDDTAGNSGSVYVYDWNSGMSTWDETKLVASDPVQGDNLGYDIAVDGDYVVAGARGKDDNGSNSGAAYIFKWHGGINAWEETKLLASDGLADDFFATAVDIEEARIVVGAYGRDDNGLTSGAIYVYEYDSMTDTWEEEKVLASDGADDDFFGFSVAIDGDRIAVGTYGDDARVGSAYYYDYYDWEGRNTSWTENKLTASDRNPSEADDFGYAVGIAADRLVVGARFGEDGISDSGAAYVYDLANCCPVFLQVSNPIDGNTYEAEVIMSDAIIPAGVSTTYSANDMVKLTVGFHAQAGSVVTCKIEGCTTTAAQNERIESRKEVVQEIAGTMDMTNYPNPFTNSTIIAIEMPTSTSAKLTVFDLNGKVVYQRAEVFEQGKTEIEFQANDLDAGVYIYRLQTDQTVISKSMVLIQE